MLRREKGEAKYKMGTQALRRSPMDKPIYPIAYGVGLLSDPKYFNWLFIYKSNLKDIFPGFNVRSIRETMLAGNQWAEQSSRLRWISDRDPIEMKTLKQYDAIPSRQKFIYTRTDKGILKTKATTILLTPMQIRTLVVELERNE